MYKCKANVRKECSQINNFTFPLHKIKFKKNDYTKSKQKETNKKIIAGLMKYHIGKEQIQFLFFSIDKIQNQPFEKDNKSEKNQEIPLNTENSNYNNQE